jgi:hypothetical protein
MLEKKMEETYESMLFRYGLPCADNLLAIKKITQIDYDQLMDYHKNKIVPPRDFVIRIFAAADERIGEIKTPEAVEDYFINRHNGVIDRKEGAYLFLPKPICENCKVHDGVIIGIDYQEIVPFPIYKIKYDDKESIAFGKYFSGFKTGDKVRVHNKEVIKKIG